MKNYVVLFLLAVSSLQAQDSFSEAALNDVFLTEERAAISFGDILKNSMGKTILIDIWAGWCRDCIEGMPKVKKLQKKYPNVKFVFLSLDKTPEAWDKAIKKYNVKGSHYFISSGWKGGFCGSIDLDWIPRYIIVGPEGSIQLHKAIEADAASIETILGDR